MRGREGIESGGGGEREGRTKGTGWGGKEWGKSSLHYVCMYMHYLRTTGAAHSNLLGLLEEVAAPDLKAGLPQALESKVIVLEGDLSKPLLGLDETVFADLASTVDVIIHNGAHVNHLLSYQSTFWQCCAHTHTHTRHIATDITHVCFSCHIFFGCHWITKHQMQTAAWPWGEGVVCLCVLDKVGLQKLF